jgi:hypothetical protein
MLLQDLAAVHFVDRFDEPGQGDPLVPVFRLCDDLIAVERCEVERVLLDGDPANFVASQRFGLSSRHAISSCVSGSECGEADQRSRPASPRSEFDRQLSATVPPYSRSHSRQKAQLRRLHRTEPRFG